MGSIYAIRKAPHAKTFGMELECYPSNNPNLQHWNKGRRLGFWEATYDESLRDDGIEWVCQPMPYTMLIKQLNRLHKQLNGWLVDHRCGLHIHVSRAYWSSSREEKFSQFLRDANSVEIKELFENFYYRVFLGVLFLLCGVLSWTYELGILAPIFFIFGLFFLMGLKQGVFKPLLEQEKEQEPEKK